MQSVSPYTLNLKSHNGNVTIADVLHFQYIYFGKYYGYFWLACKVTRQLVFFPAIVPWANTFNLCPPPIYSVIHQ